jgi:hypothetical protein
LADGCIGREHDVASLAFECRAPSGLHRRRRDNAERVRRRSDPVALGPVALHVLLYELADLILRLAE